MTERKRKTKETSAVSGLEWASDVKLTDVPWLWNRCIPAHTLTMIEGRKCSGKSSLLSAIAASFTGGPVIPGWSGPRNGRVIWCGSEESWEAVTVPRLQRAGAELRYISRLALSDAEGRKRRLLLPEHFGELREIIEAGKIGLLILDPYISLVSTLVDTRMEQAIRSVLEPLLDLSWEMECTTLLVRHVRKGRTGDAREAGLGGAALTNVCRSLIRVDEHPHLPGHSIMSPVVVSAAGKALPGQVFRLDYDGEGPPLTWVGATDLDAQTVAEGVGDAVERGETREAEQLLVELIGTGWVRTTTVNGEAMKAGISLRALRRAKERLIVRSRRVSYADEGYWEWGLPEHGWPESIRNLLSKKRGRTRGGALPEANGKKSEKPQRTAKGAKAPPPCARGVGALPETAGGLFDEI